MRELFEMIKAAQKRADKRTLSKRHITEALGCYANAISFCDTYGLPYQTIRVQACGGYGFASNYGAKATFFEYDGATWTAYRARVGGKPNKNQMGYFIRAWVEADEEHKSTLRLLGGHKKKGQKLWAAEIPKKEEE
jgi:hypothetical protein